MICNFFYNKLLSVRLMYVSINNHKEIPKTVFLLIKKKKKITLIIFLFKFPLA